LPLPSARLAEVIPGGAQREKGTAVGDRVDQLCRPVRPDLDAVRVEESDLLCAGQAGANPYLCAQVMVKLLDVRVIVGSGIAQEQVQLARRGLGVRLRKVGRMAGH